MVRLFTKLFSAMLACAVAMTIAPVTTHAEGEDADAGYNVKILYTGDEDTKYYSVQQNDGTTIYLYCLQSKRHWPGSTSYRQISFQEFCENNELTDPASIAVLAEKMRRVLYAGFNYNGLGLYSSSGKEPITAADLNSFLYLSDTDALRLDFRDLSGNFQFTYEKRDDPDQRQRIKGFIKDFMDNVFLAKKPTKSGMDASQVEAMPFYKAAHALYWYAYNAENNGPKKDPTEFFSNDAYDGTSYAVWSLSGQNKIKDSEVLSVAGIGKKLLDAADDPNASILKAKPTDPQLTQNAVFTYKNDDQKWHSSPIKLSADGISTWFTLSLPSGVTAVGADGNIVTEIKAGDSFSLISDKEPEEKIEFSVSSLVPWMDENGLVVYEPADPSFQNMVGAIIHTEYLSASTTVQKGESITFTKKWVDDNNASGKRPDVSSYAKSLTLLAGGEEQSGYVAEITDNGDNTYTVSYKGLPKLVDGMAYSVKEAAVEGYNSDSPVVSDGGTLTNTLVVPTPSPTATATVSTPAPTATVTVKENKPVRAVSPAVVKPVPPTGVESSHGENGN